MTLSPENQKMLQDRWGVLSVELQEALSSNVIQTISAYAKRRYNLSDAQITSLENELVLLLMGFVMFNELSDVLTSEAEIPADTVATLISDIENTLPADVISQLRELQDAENAIEKEGSPKVAAAETATVLAEKSASAEAPAPQNVVPTAEKPTEPTLPSRYQRPLTGLPRYTDEK